MKHLLRRTAFCVFLPVLTSCANQSAQDVQFKAIIAEIHELSGMATECLDSNNRTSRSCSIFASAYKSDGFKNMQMFKDNLTEIYAEDLDAGIAATQEILTISSAVTFIVGTVDKAGSDSLTR